MREMLAGVADRLSLHMPGAQGRGPFGPVDPYRLETTELGVTDDLYAPCGAIARAEALAARCAGAAHTLMLTGGSTAGVQAMLLYAAGGAGAVILPRNAHLSALHLCAVAGLDVVFARPSFTASGLCYTPDESYLEALERRPDARALLVVRPDYYGALHWPARAAARARALGVPVLCDEAHGAHLNWDVETPTAARWGRMCGCSRRTRRCPRSTARHGCMRGRAWTRRAFGRCCARCRAAAVVCDAACAGRRARLDGAKRRGGRRAAQGRGGAVSRAGGGAGLRRWAGRAGLGLRPHARGAPGPAGRVRAFGGAGRAARGRGDERR